MGQPHLLAHPNGVVALTETVVCVADVAAAEERFRRVTGIVPLRHGRARIFAFAAGRLVLCDPASLGDFMTDLTPPILPWLAGFTVATDDGNAAAREILLRNRPPFAPPRAAAPLLPADPPSPPP